MELKSHSGSLLERDQAFMRRALELARAQLGRTTPNPAVACLIVRNGRVVGSGATAAGGRPHAEPQALAAAGARTRGATAYVTFEPCAHLGQTRPCADALASSGLARVVIGCLDPYPAVRGRGIARLRRAGIEVTVGVLADECRRLNEGFIARVTRRRPFVLLKLAVSLDGRIAAAGGDSKWISSPQSRRLAHRWRAECDAVMVGAGTVLADDPRLTCRLRRGRDPARVVFDPRLRTTPNALVYGQRSRAITVLVTSKRRLGAARRRFGSGRVELLGLNERAGRLSVAELMAALGRRGWCRVMIEGGARLAAAALAAGIVDRVAFFVAPKIVGGGLSAIEGLRIPNVRAAIKLQHLRATAVGPDVLLEADIVPGR